MNAGEVAITAGLGAVSLFPTLGKIEKLENFYPADRREWFIRLSTVFSLVVFAAVTFFFERFNFYVPIGTALAGALVLLTAYLLFHLTLRGSYDKLPAVIYAPLIVALFLLYTGWIASLTYTFNVLNQFRDHEVVQGIVSLVDASNAEGTTTVTFGLREGTDIPTLASDSGSFTKILTDTDFAKISSITVEHRDAHNVMTHYSTWRADEVALRENFRLIVRKTEGI